MIQLPQIHLIFQVSNVEFRTGSSSVREHEMLLAAQEEPLAFVLVDGTIQKICTSEDKKQEPPWVLNFKRGILSAFQNAVSGNDDDDNDNGEGQDASTIATEVRTYVLAFK